MRFRHQILRAALTVALVYFSRGTAQAQPDSSAFEMRCLWVVRSDIATPGAIDELIRFAQLKRFNNLIVQVRGRGDAYYNSSFIPKGSLIRDKSFDPLEYLIDKAHAHDIKIHAWVNTYLLWSDSRLPEDRRHLLYEHPEWLDISSAGRLRARELVENMEVLREGHEGLYLSPGHPEVTPYLLKVFKEILSNYDIDGLHLDYVRYQDVDFGRNPTSRQIYERNNGDDPLVLLSTSSEWSGQEELYENRIRKWNDYRSYLVTDLVKQTSVLVNLLKPDCILSAAVKPNLYDARDQFFQEWDVWLAAGYLDLAIPMNYTPELREYANNISIIYDNLPAKYRARIIMGMAVYNQPAEEAIDKLKYTRITRFTGICFFSYNTFLTDPAYTNKIYQELFR